MQQVLLDGIGHRHEEVLRLVRVRVRHRQVRHRLLEVACLCRVARRIAGDVDVRRHVAVDAEVGRRRRAVVDVVRRDEPLQVGVDLAHVLVGARLRHAVARRVVGRRAGEVVALLDGDDEERVVLRDPVLLHAREELSERLVVVLELLDVPGLAGTVRVMDLAREPVGVVRVGEVAERHGNAGLLHLRDLGQRIARKHPVEAREAALVELVGDVLRARDVADARIAVSDRRVDVLRAEERLARVAARLVRQRIHARVRGVLRVCRADAAGHRTVDGEADEVGLRKVARSRSRRRDLRVTTFDPLVRARAEDLGHVARRIGGVHGERAPARMRLRQRRRERHARAGRACGSDRGDRHEFSTRGRRLDHPPGPGASHFSSVSLMCRPLSLCAWRGRSVS